MADAGGSGAAEGGEGGEGGGLPLLEDMEARIKRSEARAERSRKRGSLGVELVGGFLCGFWRCGLRGAWAARRVEGAVCVTTTLPSILLRSHKATNADNTQRQPERDCRRKIGCRLMNLGNSCYQNWCVFGLFVGDGGVCWGTFGAGTRP